MSRVAEGEGASQTRHSFSQQAGRPTDVKGPYSQENVRRIPARQESVGSKAQAGKLGTPRSIRESLRAQRSLGGGGGGG